MNRTWAILSVLGILAATCVLTQTGASAQSTPGGGASAPTAAVVGSLRVPHGAPARIALGKSGETLLTDPRAGTITISDAAGKVTGLKHGFSIPFAIEVGPTGNIYVGEQGTGSVNIYNSAWQLIGSLGIGKGEFQQPTDIAIDPDPTYGNVYVVDGKANVVKIYLPSGTYASSFGSKGTGDGQFDLPSAAYVSADGNVFVCDQRNNRIEVFDRVGTYIRQITRSVKGTLQGLTGDALGRLFVADAFQGNVQVYDLLGTLLTTIGGFGSGPAGQLRTPVGLRVDAFNRLLVSSFNSSRIEVFGLDNVAGGTLVTQDGVAPTVSITSDTTDPNLVHVTVTFSEAVFGFDAGGLVVSNGLIQNFSGSGTTYTFDVAPLTEGAVSVQIASGLGVDQSGNGNTSGSVAWTYTPEQLSSTIALANASPTSANSVGFDVYFSRSLSAPLTAAKVVLVPGSLAGAISVTGSGAQYHVTVALADPNANGTVAIAVAAGAVADASGNLNVSGISPVCAVHNWSGLNKQPAGARLYFGDSYTLAVGGNFGPFAARAQWTRSEGQGKTLHDGPANLNWTLSNVTAADQGQYWCTVNVDGTQQASSVADIVVAASHLKITQLPVDGVAKVGTAHIFTVATEGGYGPVSYTWLKDGQAIADATGSSYQKNILSPADAGVYTVMVADTNGDVQTATAKIAVAPVKVPVAGGAGMLAAVGLISLLGTLKSRKRK